MKNILVVDDDPDCIEFATEVLEHRYKIRSAASVEECRRELCNRKPDLILLDVMMSHLSDGLDLTRELKEDDEARDIPVIMLTNVNKVYNYRDQVRADYFPHDRWLDKPVKPDVLLAAVSEALGETK